MPPQRPWQFIVILLTAPQPPSQFIFCLSCFCTLFFSWGILCNHADTKQCFWLQEKGREFCWFCCKLHFSWSISWENGILPVLPFLSLFTAYFQQPCNCFPFCKRNSAPFLYFNYVSCPDLLCWRALMGMPCCFGSRGKFGINNGGGSLLGEAVPLWVQKHIFFHGALPDISSLPIRNSIFFGLPWDLKSIPHNITLALCYFIFIVISWALLLTHFS